jgi:hypothetical protein
VTGGEADEDDVGAAALVVASAGAAAGGFSWWRLYARLRAFWRSMMSMGLGRKKSDHREQSNSAVQQRALEIRKVFPLVLLRD